MDLNLYSCESTIMIAKFIEQDLRLNSLMSARKTEHFSDIGFSHVTKSVIEMPTYVKITIKATMFCQVSKHEVEYAAYRLGDNVLKQMMVDELNEVLFDTTENIVNRIKSTCETVQMMCGRVNKEFRIIPDIVIKTDGQYI